jgi:hypothetical protein
MSQSWEEVKAAIRQLFQGYDTLQGEIRAEMEERLLQDVEIERQRCEIQRLWAELGGSKRRSGRRWTRTRMAGKVLGLRPSTA